VKATPREMQMKISEKKMCTMRNKPHNAKQEKAARLSEEEGSV